VAVRGVQRLAFEGVCLPASDPPIFGACDTCSVGVGVWIRSLKAMLSYAWDDAGRETGVLAEVGAVLLPLLLPLLPLSCRRSTGKGGIPRVAGGTQKTRQEKKKKKKSSVCRQRCSFTFFLV